MRAYVLSRFTVCLPRRHSLGFKLLASTNITCLDINMMVNFKPGEYMRMMSIQSTSDTGGSEKNPSSPNRSRTVTNILHTVRTGMSIGGLLNIYMNLV